MYHWLVRSLPWALALSLGLLARTAGAQQEEPGWFDDGGGASGAGLDSAPPSAPAPDPYAAPPRGDGAAPGFAAPEELPPDVAADSESDEDESDPAARERALREFSPHLAAHGFWVEDPVYGRVWVPRRAIVGGGFVPYATGGHWELAEDDEWLWVSDYPFGWVTFHYGRWVWLSGGRWGWVPGYRYAPAWVSFRIGANGYVGWGPLLPRYVWRHGVYVSIYGYDPVFGPPLVFCPTPYLFSRSMRWHLIRERHRVRQLERQTRPYRARRLARSGRVARGPALREIRVSRSSVPTSRRLAQPRPSFVGEAHGGSTSRASSARRSRVGSSTLSGKATPSAPRARGSERDRAASRARLPAYGSTGRATRSRSARPGTSTRSTWSSRARARPSVRQSERAYPAPRLHPARPVERARAPAGRERDEKKKKKKASRSSRERRADDSDADASDSSRRGARARPAREATPRRSSGGGRNGSRSRGARVKSR